MKTSASHSAILLRSILLILLIVAQVIVPATGEPLTCEALCGGESRAHMDCSHESCGADGLRLHAGSGDAGCRKDHRKDSHRHDSHRNDSHRHDSEHSIPHGSACCGEDHHGRECPGSSCGENICHEQKNLRAETGHSSDNGHHHDGTSCQLQGCHCCAFIMFLTDTYDPAQPSLHAIRFWPASLDATIDPRPAPPDHPPC